MPADEQNSDLDRILTSLREQQTDERAPQASAQEAELMPETATPAMQDAGDAAADAPERDAYSLLELCDRVAVMLIFNQIVRGEQVEETWRRWHQTAPEERPAAFWRMLLHHPEIDREAVFNEAARVHGFETVNPSPDRVLGFLRDRRDAFSDEQWKRLCALSILPLPTQAGSGAGWTFATHDPNRPEVEPFLGTLVEAYTLRYASEASVHRLLADAFPQWRERPAWPSGTSDGAPALNLEPASAATHFVDKMLTEAVWAGASKLYFFPTAQDHLEVHHAVDGQLVKQHREEQLSAASVMRFLKEDVVRFSEGKKAHVISRRIGEERLRFEVAYRTIEDERRDMRAEMVTVVPQVAATDDARPTVVT